MGRSRMKRRGPAQQKTQHQTVPELAQVNPPIPDITRLDVAFGNISHMPRYDTLPDDFRRYDGNAYCLFVAHWFFSGLKMEDLARLTPKPGVDRTKALAAIRAIMTSFAPKHEHKKAGCAWLLAQWFTLDARQNNKEVA